MDEYTDDFLNPRFSKEEIEACDDIGDCQVKSLSKVCQDTEANKIINESNTEIYCSKQVGFHQIKTGNKIVGIDKDLKSEYDQKKDADEKLRSGVAKALADIEFGMSVFATVQVMNKAKGLSDEERQQFSCLLYTSPSPRDQRGSRMPSSA